MFATALKEEGIVTEVKVSAPLIAAYVNFPKSVSLCVKLSVFVAESAAGNWVAVSLESRSGSADGVGPDSRQQCRGTGDRWLVYWPGVLY